MRSRIHKRTRALGTFAQNVVSIRDDRAYRHITLRQRHPRQLEAAPHVLFMRQAGHCVYRCSITTAILRVQEEMSPCRLGQANLGKQR
jgi:hypothetical protein